MDIFHLVCSSRLFFFFFQAEDGIRDKLVTGVQTCALPISFGGCVGRSGLLGPSVVSARRLSRAPRRSQHFKRRRRRGLKQLPRNFKRRRLPPFSRPKLYDPFPHGEAVPFLKNEVGTALLFG